MEKEDDINLIREVLIDIGFTDEDRCKFIEVYNYNTRSANQILIEYRGKLLNTICDSQEKLYLVDYLMKMLNKNEVIDLWTKKFVHNHYKSLGIHEHWNNFIKRYGHNLAKDERGIIKWGIGHWIWI